MEITHDFIADDEEEPDIRFEATIESVTQTTPRISRRTATTTLGSATDLWQFPPSEWLSNIVNNVLAMQLNVFYQYVDGNPSHFCRAELDCVNMRVHWTPSSPSPPSPSTGSTLMSTTTPNVITAPPTATKWSAIGSLISRNFAGFREIEPSEIPNNNYC